MINGHFVVDAVGHGYNLRDDNRHPDVPREIFDGFRHQVMHRQVHQGLEKRAPGFSLSFEELTYGWNAEDVAHAFFEESDVDLLIYHEVVIGGIFQKGSSPWDTGAELKRAYPERVLLYCYVDPLNGPSELEHMEARAATGLVDGFKFYPANGLFDPATGLPRVQMYDDREYVFQFFEKARDLGVSRIAVHKGVPVGPGPLDKERPEDVSVAALAFPDLTFEVVHSGWAFLEECAMQLNLHPNIYANLETVCSLAVRRPRKFASILGELLLAGGEDRILFGTGATAVHPQPVVEAFADFQMPRDLIDGYDYPEISDEIKAKIFGLNAAKLHGIDPVRRMTELRADKWAECRSRAVATGQVGPWRTYRERIAAETAALV